MAFPRLVSPLHVCRRARPSLLAVLGAALFMVWFSAGCTAFPTIALPANPPTPTATSSPTTPPPAADSTPSAEASANSPAETGADTARLYPSGAVQGVFLAQLSEVNALLPGIVDINAAAPFDPGIFGSGAYVTLSPEITAYVRGLGYAVITGRLVVVDETGQKTLIENITSYRDPAANSFYLALPNQLLTPNAGGELNQRTLDISTQIFRLADGSPVLAGLYGGGQTHLALGSIPIETAYQNLFVVSAAADQNSVPVPEGAAGQTFAPGELAALVLQPDPAGGYQVLCAIPLLSAPDSVITGERAAGKTTLRWLDEETRAERAAISCAYNVSTLGIPVKHSALQAFLPGYTLKMLERGGQPWVLALNEQGSMLYFRDDVVVTGSSVVGYMEKDGAVWEVLMTNRDGVLSLKATLLPDFTWSAAEPE